MISIAMQRRSIHTSEISSNQSYLHNLRRYGNVRLWDMRSTSRVLSQTAPGNAISQRCQRRGSRSLGDVSQLDVELDANNLASTIKTLSADLALLVRAVSSAQSSLQTEHTVLVGIAIMWRDVSSFACRTLFHPATPSNWKGGENL